MAARGSSSTGMWVTLTILGLLSLGLLVATMVFYGQLQTARSDIEVLTGKYREIVTDAEINRDDVAQMKTKARAARGQSVVGYLVNDHESIMNRITGSRRDSFDQMQDKLASVVEDDSTSILNELRSMKSENGSLKAALSDATTDLQAALSDLSDERNRVGELQSQFATELEAYTNEIDQYKAQVERYRSSTDVAKEDMDERLDEMRLQYQESEFGLNSQLAELRQRNLILEETVKELRGEKRNELFRPTDEYALVDGNVAAISPANESVTLDIGRRQKVILGMTFAVYSNPSAIRPGPDGQYPMGKATLEVINVEDNACTAQVIRQSAGNPVVRGDVIANAIYDPNKVYKFVCYGNFDIDGDGISTPHERDDLNALIREWGGEVVDTLDGDVDFLILGERPTLPPPPPASADEVVVLEYIRLNEVVTTYDRLYEQAAATSMPILNQNRLFTLIGR